MREEREGGEGGKGEGGREREGREKKGQQKEGGAGEDQSINCSRENVHTIQEAFTPAAMLAPSLPASWLTN